MFCMQAEMTWNHDGTLLASASSKGTVIRIHRLPQVHSFSPASCHSCMPDHSCLKPAPFGHKPERGHAVRGPPDVQHVVLPDGVRPRLCHNRAGPSQAARTGCYLQATQIFTFRRGTYPAVIHSMAFSGPGIEPPLLCAASGHGTVHLFRLEKSDR